MQPAAGTFEAHTQPFLGKQRCTRQDPSQHTLKATAAGVHARCLQSKLAGMPDMRSRAGAVAYQLRELRFVCQVSSYIQSGDWIEASVTLVNQRHAMPSLQHSLLL